MTLKTRPTKHVPTLQTKDLPEFWERLENYSGHPLTRLALHLLMLTMLRPGEVRFAEWAEFDLDDALWTIPGHRMKIKSRRTRSEKAEAPPHLVPL